MIKAQLRDKFNIIWIPTHSDKPIPLHCTHLHLLLTLVIPFLSFILLWGWAGKEFCDLHPFQKDFPVEKDPSWSCERGQFESVSLHKWSGCCSWVSAPGLGSVPRAGTEGNPVTRAHQGQLILTDQPLMWSCYWQRPKSLFGGLGPKACPGYRSHLLHSAEIFHLFQQEGDTSPLPASRCSPRRFYWLINCKIPHCNPLENQMPSVLPPTSAQLPKLTYRIITVMFYSHWEKKINPFGLTEWCEMNLWPQKKKKVY